MAVDDGISLEEKVLFLKELKEARFSGAHRVKFRERDVTYRSDAELIAAIKDLEEEIQSTTGTVKRRASLAVYGSGL